MNRLVPFTVLASPAVTRCARTRFFEFFTANIRKPRR
jgi:hypothetical protein